MTVFRDASKFSSSVHRKDTFSGVYTNYRSFMPETYKKGLVSTLLYRAFMICSSFQSLHQEIERLKNIFSKNGYPSKLVDKCIFNFFNKQYEKRPAVHTVPKKEMLLVLPFLGTNSWKTKNELIRSFRKILPFCNLKIVYKTTKRLSSCFSFKDKFPKSLMSGVIYRYTCAECNLSYVGCTKRFWEKRLEEHLHVSGLTGKPLSGMIVYAPLQHVKSGTCTVQKIFREDFTIIGHEKDPYLVQLKESIIIKTTRPTLNGNLTSVPVYLF